jgi:hypothetical protein
MKIRSPEARKLLAEDLQENAPDMLSTLKGFGGVFGPFKEIGFQYTDEGKQRNIEGKMERMRKAKAVKHLNEIKETLG